MSAIKMDELLVSWLASNDVYDNVLELIENYRVNSLQSGSSSSSSSNSGNNNEEEEKKDNTSDVNNNNNNKEGIDGERNGGESLTMNDGGDGISFTTTPASSPNNAFQNNNNTNNNNNNNNNQNVKMMDDPTIPPFYPIRVSGRIRKRRQTIVSQKDTWDPLPEGTTTTPTTTTTTTSSMTSSPSSSLASPTSNKNNNDKNNNTSSSLGSSAANPIPLLPKLLDSKDPNNNNNTNNNSNNNNSSSTTTTNDSNNNNSNNKDATEGNNNNNTTTATNASLEEQPQEPTICVRDQTMAIYTELGQDPPLASPTSDDEDDIKVGTGGGGRRRGREGGDNDNDKNHELDNDTTRTTTEPVSNNMIKKLAQKYLTMETFVRVTKDICGFPSFFNVPLYNRILYLWNAYIVTQIGPSVAPMEVITLEMLEWYWKTEMEPYDPCDRFFRLIAQVQDATAIVRDDFLPFIKALLQDHPGLEFLSSHAEFQEKYAVTVITRIFYSVNTCHSGRITARQVRRSDLLEAFQQVDEEEDINKVTRYFSYEHFYVLYCRFWELDHDRDYRITREDLLKYGDQSLSHMIVDRIFDAAPRPFEPQQVLLQQQQQQQRQQQQQTTNLDDPIQPLTPAQQQQQQQPPGGRPTHRDYLSYEDFIYFMLSEEDKSNEVSVKYWFTCVDVDGDGKLNNMELRSFYAVQLHRMQFMGHEIVPFEDMLCQMMDMIKPLHNDYLIERDFLQPECRQVSGALFDALFNLNKYLLFEQRDPFVERQKREDEFDCDWDRFACLDYSRLAMEEEAREEEAMEIDWVTVDDDDDEEEEEDDDEDDDDDDDEDDDGRDEVAHDAVLHAHALQQQLGGGHPHVQQQQQHLVGGGGGGGHAQFHHHHGGGGGGGHLQHHHHHHLQQHGGLSSSSYPHDEDDLQHTDDDSENDLQGAAMLLGGGGGGGNTTTTTGGGGGSGMGTPHVPTASEAPF